MNQCKAQHVPASMPQGTDCNRGQQPRSGTDGVNRCRSSLPGCVPCLMMQNCNTRERQGGVACVAFPAVGPDRVFPPIPQHHCHLQLLLQHSSESLRLHTSLPGSAVGKQWLNEGCVMRAEGKAPVCNTRIPCSARQRSGSSVAIYSCAVALVSGASMLRSVRVMQRCCCCAVNSVQAIWRDSPMLLTNACKDCGILADLVPQRKRSRSQDLLQEGTTNVDAKRQRTASDLAGIHFTQLWCLQEP